jgi:hypothetical protein
VTRPRPSAPGHPHPVRRLPLLPLVAGAALLAGACLDGGADATLAPTAAASLAASPSPEASFTSPAPTDVPTASPTPTETATNQPPPSPSAEGVVADCTGTDDNRTFYATAATNLDWPVYCPALPARWFVSTGSYSGGGGGRLVIDYKGPGGATLSVQQGAFCEDGDGCVGSGSDVGAAAFGDQTGTLVSLDDGGFAIVVDRGANPSWLAIGTGLDEATFRGFAAAFVRLD